METSGLYFVIFAFAALAFHNWARNYSWYEWRSNRGENESNDASPENKNASKTREDVIQPAFLLPEIKPSPTKQEKTKKWHQHTEDKKWALDILVFAVGIAAVIIYFFQMGANMRQAKAAENQLLEMQKESKLDERAWVAINDLKPMTDGIGAVSGISCTLQNPGKTPAFIANIKVTVDVKTVRPIETNSFQFNFPGTAIAPSGHVDFQITNEIGDRINYPNSSWSSCFYSVEIVYTNAFGSTNHTDVYPMLNFQTSPMPYYDMGYWKPTVMN